MIKVKYPNDDRDDKMMRIIKPVTLFLIDKVVEVYGKDKFNSRLEALDMTISIYVNVLASISVNMIREHAELIKKEFNADREKDFRLYFMKAVLKLFTILDQRREIYMIDESKTTNLVNRFMTILLSLREISYSVKPTEDIKRLMLSLDELQKEMVELAYGISTKKQDRLN